MVIYDASVFFQVLTEQVLFLQEKSFIFARPQFLLPAERTSKHQLSKTCIHSVKANAYIFISVSIYYKWKHLPFPLKPSLPLPPFNFIKASVGPVYVPNGVHRFADENLYI